jgi:hypothetical protein
LFSAAPDRRLFCAAPDRRLFWRPRAAGPDRRLFSIRAAGSLHSLPGDGGRDAMCRNLDKAAEATEALLQKISRSGKR